MDDSVTENNNNQIIRMLIYVDLKVWIKCVSKFVQIHVFKYDKVFHYEYM